MPTSDELRRSAEERARLSGTESGVPGLDDTWESNGIADRDVLIHELRVHQIELELQNEELRRAHTVLEESRAEYADLYDDAPVGYLSLDANAVVTRANRTFPSMLGLTHDRLIGRQIADFLAPTAREAFLRRFGALFREPAGKSVDATFVTTDGAERVLHLSAHRPNAAPGKPAADALRVAVVDVTDRRRAEAQVKELLEQKELLFRELRHRTSNNYQVVLAMLALQADIADDARVTDALEQAQSRIQAMLVVQDSLADSQLDIRTEIGPYLRTLLDRIVSALDPDKRVKTLTLIADGYANADTASSIGLIVNELATNAWKHALAGREAGRLEVHLAEAPNGWVLTMLDDGASPTPPIPHRCGRHGLGQSLVEALAGQLEATFERQTTADGTTCTLRLPPAAITAPGDEPSRPAPTSSAP